MSGERETGDRMLHAVASPAPGPAVDLERVFREHNRLVLRAAFRITGSAQDAEDVLQTVFLRLARREGGTGLSDSPSHYLHRAAVNAALDIVRSRQAARASSLDDVEATLASPEVESPAQVSEGAELKDRVRAALGRMNPRNAEIFALRYFEGYGNHEIAKMLGTSRSTINVILHRMRERLREELGSPAGGAP
jgi:RNA polymerase sigma-70 factor (ECF subfamily)